jgi:uncharacterized protein YuzE
VRIKYDKEVDVMYISLTEEPTKESDESKKGIIIDYSERGSIVSIEILDASKKILQPGKVEYEVA